MSADGSGKLPVFVGRATVAQLRETLRALDAEAVPHLRQRLDLLAPECPAGWQPEDLPADRVHVRAGPACLEAFVRHWATRLESALPGRVVAQRGEQQAASAVATALSSLGELQRRQADRLRDRLDARAKQRGPGWWGLRGQRIAAGSPPRVLVVTTRFSTMLQHAARDFADAINARGGRARVSLENDDHGFRSPGLTLRHVLELDPDLVVGLNCHRQQIREHLPADIPCLCWIQDAMPHLFPAPPEPLAPMDFLAGNWLEGSKFCEAHPPERVLEFPVPVSTAKFCRREADTLDPAARCDLAYASHQSGSAEELHRAWCEKIPDDRRPACDHARDQVVEAVERWPDEDGWQRVFDAGERLAAELDSSNDAQTAFQVRASYLQPLAERLLRHTMLRWAGDIADRHGLTFRIHGNGWEQHPTLRRWAAGPLDHGDALRKSYASAAVHLHASVLGTNHPRVAECALSGGLPLCRRSWGELYRDNYLDTQAFADQTPADACLLSDRRDAWVVQRHPELVGLLGRRDQLPPLPPQYDPLGWDHTSTDELFGQPRGHPRHRHWSFRLADAHRSLVLLDDPFELTFSTREELEERILRAVADPSWREQASRRLAEHAEKRVTTGAFANGVVQMVAAGLSAASGREAPR